MKITIVGLALLSVDTPFLGYFGTLLDLRGPWTQEMLDAEPDEGNPIGLAVWEGECDVETHDAGTDDESKTFKFRGSYRALTADEATDLLGRRMPLSDRSFPASGDDLIRVPDR